MQKDAIMAHPKICIMLNGQNHCIFSHLLHVFLKKSFIWHTSRLHNILMTAVAKVTWWDVQYYIKYVFKISIIALYLNAIHLQ